MIIVLDLERMDDGGPELRLIECAYILHTKYFIVYVSLHGVRRDRLELKSSILVTASIAGWGTGGPVWRTHPDWVCEIAVCYLKCTVM